MADLSGIKLGSLYLEVLPEVQQRAFQSAAISAGTQFAREMGQKFGTELNTQMQRQAQPALSRFAQGAKDAAGTIVSGMNSASLAVSRLSTQIALTAFGFQLIGQNINRYVTQPLTQLTVGLLKFGVTGAASLEANAILMKNIVGSTGDYKQIFGDLVKLAIASPVFDTEALTKYSAQLLGAGFQTKKILPFMNALGNLFLSQGLDANQASQSLLALTQMYSKGRISGQELNIQLRNAFPGSMKIFNQAARNLGVKGVEGLIAAIDAGHITMDQFFDQLTKIGNSQEFVDKAKEASGGLRSSWIQLQETLKTKFSMAFLDENFRLKPELKAAFDHFSQLVSGLADAFIAKIPVMVGWFQKLLEKIDKLKKDWDELDPKTQALIERFIGLLAVMGPLSTVLGTLGIFAGTFVRAFAFAALSTTGIILSGILLTLGGMALAFYELWKNSEDFRQGVANFTDEVRRGWEEKIKPGLAAVRKEIRENLIPALNDLLTAIGFKSWSDFGTWLGKDFVTTMENVVLAIFTAIHIFKLLVEQVTEAINFFRYLGDQANKLKTDIDAAIFDILAIWGRFHLSLVETIIDLQLKFSNLRDHIIAVWSQITQSVMNAKEQILSTWQDLILGIRTEWDKIKDIFKQPIEVILKFYNDGIGGLWNAAKTIFTSLPAFVAAPTHLATGGEVPRIPGVSGDWVPLYGTAGEYMLSQKNVATLGGVSGIQSILAGAEHYADGGPIGIVKALAGKALDVAKNIIPGEFLANTAIKALTGGIGEQLDGLGGALGGMPKAIGKAILDAAVNAIKGVDQVSGGGSLGTGGRSVEKLIGLVKAQGLRYTVNSTDRPGDPGYHGQGKAVDFGGDMTGIARYFMKYSGALLELIHGDSHSFVKNGKVVGQDFYGPETVAQHSSWGNNEHVHVAANGDAVFGGGVGLSGGTSAGLAQLGSLGAWFAAASQYTSIEWPEGLRTLIMRESGGNPSSINLWDSNAHAGHPSMGLMQTIGPTFEAYRDKRLPDNMFDPIANIVAGMNYIHARYGSLFNVQQAHAERSPMGYDNGGFLPPGLFNGTGVPEPVFTGSQWSVLEQNIASPGEHDGPITLVIEGTPFTAMIAKNNSKIADAFRRGRK